MKKFIISTVMTVADDVEGRKADERMIYQYLNSFKNSGLVNCETLRGRVVLQIEGVVH